MHWYVASNGKKINEPRLGRDVYERSFVKAISQLLVGRVEDYHKNFQSEKSVLQSKSMKEPSSTNLRNSTA